MKSSGKAKKSAKKRPESKENFIRQIGIGPDLARFLTDFTERPEIISSLSSDRYREIESQMDAILSSLGQQG